MGLHQRLIATLAVCLGAYGVLLEAFRLLNLPRNLAVLGGVALIFVLLAALPAILISIWRRL